MKLRSFYSGTVFWRIFDMNDTIHIFGYRDGTIRTGETIEITHPQQEFQLELKRDWWAGEFIERAGARWKNSDSLILNANGFLQREEDAVSIILDNRLKVSTVGAAVRFFDLDKASSDIVYKITTTLGYSTSDQFGDDTTIQSSVTNEKGVEVAPKAEVQTSQDNTKVGVEVAARVSNKIIQKIEDTVKRTRSLRIENKFQRQSEHEIIAKAGFVTAYTVIWQRQYVTGKITYADDDIAFDATTDYITSIKKEEFDSLDEMKKTNIALYREYERQGLNKVPTFS